MITIKKAAFIKAPVEKVWAYLIDPRNVPEYFPSVQAVSDIKPLPNGGYSNRWSYRLAGIRFSGTGETVECVENQRIVDKIQGGLDSTQIWTFAGSDGGTRATFEVQYAIPIPLVGWLLERLMRTANERDGDRLMATL